MPKRAKHSVHRKHVKRAPHKSSSLLTKFFAFIGLAVIVAIASYQSGLVSSFQSNVLGDSNSGDQPDQPQGQQVQAQAQVQNAGTPGAPQQFQINQQNGETEIQGPNGTIHAKVEDNGSLQVQDAKPGFQFKVEDQNGQQELQVEDAKGNTLQESEQQKLEKDLSDQGIDISTEDGKFALTRNNVKALSDQPFSVDTTRKQIMITLPNGNTVPLMLPDVAIGNLSNFGILTNFGSGSGTLNTGTPSGALTLSSTNNIPTYTVPGYKEKNLLGLFPIQVPVSAVVSAQTGAVMAQNQDVYSKLLDYLSF